MDHGAVIGAVADVVAIATEPLWLAPAGRWLLRLDKKLSPEQRDALTVLWIKIVLLGMFFSDVALRRWPYLVAHAACAAMLARWLRLRGLA